ncbi:MAG TPA: hypothetical protein VG099_03365 [Gemmataceae bacterium]|nr:hypothetical protein [Gemmataceae bacterium]
MRFRRWMAAAVLGLLVPIMAVAQESQKVAGQVLDAAGKPVVGADVATFWSADKGKMAPFNGVPTDKEGKFSLSMQFYGFPQALLAMDKERKTGGLIVVDGKAAPKSVEIKLGPLVKVRGSFFCKELDRRPVWTNVYMTVVPRVRVLQCTSTEAAFSFLLPPGTYQFMGYGSDIQNLTRDLTLTAEAPDLDLKTLDMAATVIARHKGKALPAWNVTDARGANKDVKLSDFKGKWVLIEFWGFW